ncbi:MAG: hypothetical protein H6741_25160 [Alphaproteobacteria bacterium]|nr:hypothetical protein [Alphaproteobacteria bacterium]MCB9795999.1 hypothetical protein [Alphaproteobacteria bacterium]
MRSLALLAALLLSLLLAGPAQASEAPPPLASEVSAAGEQAPPAPLPHYRLSTQGVPERAVFLRTWAATAGGMLGTTVALGLLRAGASAATGSDSPLSLSLIPVGWAAGVLVPAWCGWSMNDAPYRVNLLGMLVSHLVGGAVAFVGAYGGVVLYYSGAKADSPGLLVGGLSLMVLGVAGGLAVASLGPAVAWRRWSHKPHSMDDEPLAQLRLAPALLRDPERRPAPGLALSLTF